MPRFPPSRVPSAGFTRVALVIFGLVAIAPLAGCAISGAVARMDTGQQLEGKVIDVDTDAPLADGRVIALYERDNLVPAHSSSVCYRVEVLTTATDGAYAFPIDRNGSPTVEAYKHGYRTAICPLGVQERLEQVDGEDVVRYFVLRRPARGKNWTDEGSYATRSEAERFARMNDTFLQPAVGTRAERFAQLWRYLSSAVCINARETRKKVVPYLIAVRGEMAELAITPQEKMRLELADELIEGERGNR